MGKKPTQAPDEKEFLETYRQLSPKSKRIVKSILDAALSEGELVSFEESKLKTALQRRKARQKAKARQTLVTKIMLLLIGLALLCCILRATGLASSLWP